MTALVQAPSASSTSIVEPEVGDQDVVMIQATHLVHSALCLSLRERMATVAPEVWEVGIALLESDDLRMQQRGIVVLLEVLTRVPHNGRDLAQHLLDRLRLSSDKYPSEATQGAARLAGSRRTA